MSAWRSSFSRFSLTAILLLRDCKSSNVGAGLVLSLLGESTREASFGEWCRFDATCGLSDTNSDREPLVSPGDASILLRHLNGGKLLLPAVFTLRELHRDLGVTSLSCEVQADDRMGSDLEALGILLRPTARQGVFVAACWFIMKVNPNPHTLLIWDDTPIVNFC